MKLKKAIGLLLCGSMLLGCLTGCGESAQPQESQEETSEYPFKIEDLDGYVFTVADSNVARWEPEEGSSDIANAVLNRVNKVEELFNCTIERIDYDEDQAQLAAQAGTKYADIVICETWSLGRFLKAKRLVDLTKLEGLNLEAEYWQRYGSTNVLQYQDMIYALGAPFACQHDEAFVMFFNKAIIEDLGLESPYDLYARDEWTMSKLLEYCQKAKKDLNGDGVFDGSDRYGFVCGHEFDGPFVLYMGAGKRFLREQEDGHFSFELNTKDAFRTINQVAEILDPFENAYDCLGMTQPDIVNLFVNGQTMFYCYSRGRGVADPIYDMADDFGVVPMPKGDDAGPDEYRCWVSHDAPNMGIFANNPDLDKTVMIVEALAYFAQEENQIEENEYLNVKLRDDTAREIVKNINQYAMIDYAWIGQQCADAGGFQAMNSAVWAVTMTDRSKKIMSSIQEIEKQVETSIQQLEDILMQKDTAQ
nr:extracellular solute-binding protein [uncultured Acetatifactor sp.]